MTNLPTHPPPQKKEIEEEEEEQQTNKQKTPPYHHHMSFLSWTIIASYKLSFVALYALHLWLQYISSSWEISINLY